MQTLIKFAISCGVGPSLKVLQKRAKDISKLLLPYEPVEIVSDLELMLKNDDKTNISKVHVFPLGGIQKSADWLSAELQSACEVVSRLRQFRLSSTWPHLVFQRA